MQRVKLQVFLEWNNALNLWGYTSKQGLKTDSKAVNKILTEYFKAVDDQKSATDKLNKVIQKQEEKIRNMELELRRAKSGKIKAKPEPN